ncbi:MAG: hypothetical protein OXQ31_24865 [Spirochaetaceae bacterium]|nr:hypothetical protein [Spirochaetaceae bacterium]
MNAMTVTGPVDADQLGVTLPHEHILIDILNQWLLAGNPARLFA